MSLDFTQCREGTVPHKSVDGTFFHSAVIESMNALREDVVVLRSELRELKRALPQPCQVPPEKYCTLYVRAMGKSLRVDHLAKPGWNLCWSVVF